MPIVEQNILPNESAADSFLYKYTNLTKLARAVKESLEDPIYYGGYHKGRPDDGYWHSSTSEEFMDDMKTDAFKLDILMYGTKDEMKAAEYKLLSENNARDNPHW